ncbi:hypothetical protein PHYBOEH_001844 [Phytophthora boehmeriae]|uniref:Uncharacterized protein n=1 Tax=Phytophthora boehmeriae TaxID=109152 RepID=A0A8T1V4W6_9STRA|nr:hypothetical protein PHYBOEH_001844 [Phytophthora boehmeriae]
MPFGVHETGEAWWRQWHNYKGNGENVSVANTITEKFGLEMADIKAGTRAMFYVQQILRRHVENNRTVIVWYAHIEPFEFENKRVSGIHFLEKGYVLVKPHTRDSDEAFSQVSTCYVIKPQLPTDSKQRAKNKMTELSKFVMSATSAIIATIPEAIESLLVDQAVKRRLPPR